MEAIKRGAWIRLENYFREFISCGNVTIMVKKKYERYTV